MTKWTTVKEYLGLNKRDGPLGLRGWLDLLLTITLVSATIFLTGRYDVPFWWQVLIYGSLVLIVLPTLTILIMVVPNRHPR